MSLLDLTVAELLAGTASGDPTPGGGSVAAVSGALGLGLVCMALEVSARRPDAPTDTGALLREATPLLERLKAHPDADVAAFEGYMAALALPKEGDVQKAARKQALGAAALSATLAPLAAARDLLTALELAERAARLAHRSIVSDVGAGTYLLGAALQATLLNVDINLGSLPEEARATALAQRHALATEGQQKASRITLAVTERLAR
ncbi:cyclodeaminase/cyclohydrolase family protein [Deinococcus altitudinis]|uniref:cyclodeaminase/cyclohydrolase family protein n=1 Tax=Deinococcus altitudinis TaxID=468914 RepID=UPI003892037E